MDGEADVFLARSLMLRPPELCPGRRGSISGIYLDSQPLNVLGRNRSLCFSCELNINFRKCGLVLDALVGA